MIPPREEQQGKLIYWRGKRSALTEKVGTVLQRKGM